MADFDFDLLTELVDEAPQVGGGFNRINYGKCTMDVVIIRWNNDTHAFETRPFKKGETVDKDKREYFQITFNVDIQEFNPALEFTYSKRVDIKKSNKASKDETKWFLTDWSEIVEPSLLKVFGKDWAKKIGKGVYVEVEDAETVTVDKEGKPKGWVGKNDGAFHVNVAPRFLRAFKSKAECIAAREERFGKKDDTELDMDEGDIPASVISDAKKLIDTMGEDQARTILAGKPLGDYEVDELIEAAKA